MAVEIDHMSPIFAGMGALDERRFRADVDARLDRPASGDAEILPLEIGAPESRRLLDRHDHSSRSSSADSCGSSQAAKWPPLSTSLK
jgi:hypothetical protein